MKKPKGHKRGCLCFACKRVSGNPLSDTEARDTIDVGRGALHYGRSETSSFKRGWEAGRAFEAGRVVAAFASHPAIRSRGVELREHADVAYIQARSSNAPTKARAFIAAEIRHLRGKGYPQKRAVAAALSVARRKGLKVPPRAKNPLLAIIGNPPASRVDPMRVPGVAAALARCPVFHGGAKPARIRVVRIPDGKRGVTREGRLRLGNATATSYKVPAKHSNKHGREWEHEWRRNRPMLLLDPATEVIETVVPGQRIAHDWLRDARGRRRRA